MNIIRKSPVDSLGYNFITPPFLPKGKDEYYLRNQQNKTGVAYRKLTAYEIEVLVRNRNTSDDWNKLLVSDAFTPELVQNCKFYGLVRIGRLEAFYLEFHNLRRPVGLYNSTIISSDLGDNVVIDNCNYLSHYIIGNDAMIVNVNELATTGYARFGNGIVKDGEEETNRIWLEVCNENGGRSIIPFDGMLPGDAYLWTRFRDNTRLQAAFKQFTDNEFDKRRGYYGEIGERTIIKNCRIIKDVWIGSDAYIKGANKLKNLTINSNANAKSQVGEGCELVNGIINEGCRIFYGVKAVRFFMASHSQLKYGARLINSYLGNNATISCCEVLNSLIFPAHEQHHNNSFLCAALIMGQSNMAAGATIGSNHNSRSPDGEIIAGRGFWPGLCVSLKHNSVFASFCILAKGDYPAELKISFPFSLVSNDTSKDQLVMMPAYWFMYNMYALARNSWKYIDRDKRTDKTQLIEYNFLAPDSINEIVHSLDQLANIVGTAYVKKFSQRMAAEEIKTTGKKLLESNDRLVNELELLVPDAENSDRKVVLIKALQAYHLYKELVGYYAVTNVLHLVAGNNIKTADALLEALPAAGKLLPWINAGGQLIPAAEINKLTEQVSSGKVKNWAAIHHFYKKQAELYPAQQLQHALAALQTVYGIYLKKNKPSLKQLLLQSIYTKEWMVKGIYDSRAKDYTNSFRKMVYENRNEMDTVTGKLETNSFIKQEQENLLAYKKNVQQLIKLFKL
jgi:NDP-sugar pyrophosphorylase family protein